MKINQNKSKISTIAIILVLTISAMLIALPTITAQEPGRMTTYAFIGATPNPVGVGQEVLLHVGITQYLQDATMGWEGLTVTVTRPDEQTETLGPYRTDATGGTGAIYIPTLVGTYTLQTHFPEQVLEDPIGGFFGPVIPAGTTMEASDSDVLELVVQEEPIEYYPGNPLPTKYWTRPIDAQLREWSVIAGSWLTEPRNLFAPYNDGPETAHVLWTTKLRTGGGLVGGALDNAEELSVQSFDMGDAYEGKFGAGIFGGGNPLIIAGKLYYEKYAGNDAYKETACIDLRTGEELWSRTLLDNRTITRGQLMYWDTYDYHGVYDYLIVAVGGGFFDPTPATWHFFDPLTGDWVYALYDLPSGTMAYGPKGEFLYYTVNTQNGWMTLWSSSNIPQLYASTSYGTMGYGQWQPMGKTVNATGAVVDFFGNPVVTPNTPFGIAGYYWNKTIPTGLPGSVSAVLDDRIIGARITNTEVNLWGLSLEPGQEGTLLFNTTWTAPSNWLTGNLDISTAAISSEGKDGVFTLWSKEERQYYAFSTETGNFLWKTQKPEHYLQIYVATTSAIVYDQLVSSGISGIVYAYDVATGDLLWTYEAEDPYTEILWTNNWWSRILFITDGKIYLGHEEHSPIDPRPRGAPFTCLNATTGEEIWRINGAFRQTHWGGHAIIGDSIIATMDTYDQRIYGIGKGPSATTVTASPKVSVQGSSVLIEGTVTDISPGTEDYALTARFPNGVPAVSDASMSDWMLHVYKQFERPADATGVTVTLEAIDPNGNYQNLGTATTDVNGNYGFTFEPEVPGQYMIIATFEGSGAYYGSTTTTYLTVDPAPTPATPIEPEEPTEPEEPVTPEEPEEPETPEEPTAAAPFITTEVAILAAVAVASVIGVAAYWALRKRK